MSVNPGRVSVLSVDDHPLLREAVAAFSSSQSDMTLVGEACNGQEMIDSSESIVPTSRDGFANAGNERPRCDHSQSVSFDCPFRKG
jgi:hypothetical protein